MYWIIFAITFLILIFVFNVLTVSFFKRDILEILVGIFVLVLTMLVNMASVFATDEVGLLDFLMIFVIFTWIRPFLDELMDKIILGRKEMNVYKGLRVSLFFFKNDLKRWKKSLKGLEEAIKNTEDESARLLIQKHYDEMKKGYEEGIKNYEKALRENSKEDVIRKIR